MSSPEKSSDVAADTGTCIIHELEKLQKQWWCFLLLGIAMIILGTLALGSSFFVTVVTVVFFGVLMLIGGMAQVISAFWAGDWGGMLLHLLIGLMYIIVGFFIIDAPVEGAAGLTLVVSVFLIIGGLFRIISSMRQQFHDWGWVTLNGVVSLMLGIMIYRQWPASGLWVIGLFVGIDMIFNGWTWVMFSLGLRAASRIEEEAG